MRWVLLGTVLTVLLVVLVFGWRGQLSERPPLQIFPDMKIQPKYQRQNYSPFFADQRVARPLVEGTVGYGGQNYEADAGHPTQNPDLLQADDAYYRGRAAGWFGAGRAWVTYIPAR